MEGLGEFTHCGEGAPQSTQRLFSFVLEISWSLLRVSGSISHNLDMVKEVQGGGMVSKIRFKLLSKG